MSDNKCLCVSTCTYCCLTTAYNCICLDFYLNFWMENLNIMHIMQKWTLCLKNQNDTFILYIFFSHQIDLFVTTEVLNIKTNIVNSFITKLLWLTTIIIIKCTIIFNSILYTEPHASNLMNIHTLYFLYGILQRLVLYPMH